MSSHTTFTIESRVQLFSALAEAAEIEHNLMCLYLYAVFSLKRSESEDLSAQELAAVARWRKLILGVALEEMNHLTLVSNLMTAIGGSPSFMRPNFPSSPGLYPSDIVIELAPFDMKTLEHFIYLERPRSEELKDAETFTPTNQYSRVSPKGRLMPTSGDYQTVGALYETIKAALEQLCTDCDEKEFFCGSKDLQIGPLDSPLPGLSLVTDKASALKAIETIITQGEGATDVADSHFHRFVSIKTEYEDLLKSNPDFVPSRPVARNPVMRKPIDPKNRFWVTEPLAAQYMDLANTLYSSMLRVLVQLYSVDERPKEAKSILLNASYTLMHAMASVAETLTYLPTSEGSNVHAGMSFAMVRSLAPLGRHAERPLLCERLLEIVRSMESLQEKLELEKRQDPTLKACIEQLKKTRVELFGVQQLISKMPVGQIQSTADTDQENGSTREAPLIHPQTAQAQSGPSESSIEISETDSIQLSFHSKKCIHSRHCVTELPKVFKANTPGKWLFAENADPDFLAAVARECPSGAIQFNRKDGKPNEPTPDVNLMRLRENGPYAFLAKLTIDGKDEGNRATLCRCGQSQNKPFCDGSHNAAQFKASGEPPTLDDKALTIRDGSLSIDRTNDGPLHVKGNVEICAGTGRVVLRTNEVRLCRCGNSKNKPVCDGSHIAAGFKDSVSV